MMPRYAFDLSQERFDTYVMDALRAGTVTRHTRDQLIAGVRDGLFDQLLIKHLHGLEDLPDSIIERAAINIIDFHFEPIVLRGMSPAQIANYFSNVKRHLSIEGMNMLYDRGLLWIGTVHHVCVFSVLYELFIYLARYHGYRKLILLHQGKVEEPRLSVIAEVLRLTHSIEPSYLRLNGNWFSALSKLATPDSVIFYLADMPPPQVVPHKIRSKRKPFLLQLDVPSHLSITIETLSGSNTFARRLDATHLALEYTGGDQLRIRSHDLADPVAYHCPLEDWLFWPLLKAEI